ncbi:MAG: hypothetical protein ACI4DO_08210 [Roseburia sp.]
MEQIIKTYLGIFMILLMTVTGIGIVAAEVEVTRAREFKSDVIIELENSDYNVNVLNACMQQAQEIGYDLDITLYGKDGTAVNYEPGGTIPSQGVNFAEVVLNYSYRTGPFGNFLQHSIRGYGR